jgi:hypothetical protein
MRVLEEKPYVKIMLKRNGEIIVEAFKNIEVAGKRYNVKSVVRSRVEVAPSLRMLVDSAINLEGCK